MKGILMTPENHQAIREDRKTVTRRLDHLGVINQEPGKWKLDLMMENGTACFLPDGSDNPAEVQFVKARYQVGDVVYLKEVWCIGAYTHKKEADIVYRLDSTVSTIVWNDWLEQHTQYGGSNVVESKWRSPLFLPAWAARDFIQITEVRAERLQDISEEDALAEGIKIGQGTWQAMEKDPDMGRLRLIGGQYPYTARYHYEALWDSINPKYSWESNPWNFRYEFKSIEVKGINE